MNNVEKTAELRYLMARHGLPPDHAPVRLGAARADAVLGGGLRPGALHEVFALDWCGGGFAALLAIRLARAGCLFWVRSDYEALEYGALSPHGLLELGGDPNRLVLIRTRSAAEALAAANDILACPHVGAVLLELGGASRSLDLVAGRRLAFAAGESGAGLVLLRESATCKPSAALTRWQVRAAPSRADDDDWGNPRFAVELIRHRLGGLGNFILEWDPQTVLFVDPLPSQLGSANADTSLRHPPPLALRARGRGA